MAMRKVIMILCYNRPEVIEKSIKRLYETQDTRGYEKYLVDVSYPLPDKMENSISLAKLAQTYGFDLIKPYRNRGVAVNWMLAAVELELRAGDVLIGMDPDSEPQTIGWCDAIVDVLTNPYENIGYCGLTRTSPPQLSTEVDESNKKYTVHDISGRKVRKYLEPVSWPMGGFSVSFMREVGIHQPRKYYGFIEIGTIKAMQDTKWDWCLLDEFYDATSDRGEDVYKRWKVLQASGQTHLSFDDYVLELRSTM